MFIKRFSICRAFIRAINEISNLLYFCSKQFAVIEGISNDEMDYENDFIARKLEISKFFIKLGKIMRVCVNGERMNKSSY